MFDWRKFISNTRTCRRLKRITELLKGSAISKSGIAYFLLDLHTVYAEALNTIQLSRN